MINYGFHDVKGFDDAHKFHDENEFHNAHRFYDENVCLWVSQFI